VNADDMKGFISEGNAPWKGFQWRKNVIFVTLIVFTSSTLRKPKKLRNKIWSL